MHERLLSKDVLSGLLFALIGFGGLWWSFSYPMGSASYMGAGFFPALVFGALGCVGALITLKAFSAPMQRVDRLAFWPMVIVLGALVVFAFSVEKLGFILTTLIVVLLATAAVSSLSWVQRILLAGVITAFCWGVFILGLGVLIPTWPELAQ